VELFAGFLADAVPGGRVCEDFGWREDLLGDGQVPGDARGAGLPAGFLLMGEDLSRRSGVCGSGGWGFFCEVGS